MGSQAGWAVTGIVGIVATDTARVTGTSKAAEASGDVRSWRLQVPQGTAAGKRRGAAWLSKHGGVGGPLTSHSSSL